MLPEVKFVAFPSDYVVLAIIALPFITGFIASRQWFDYETMVVIHIISGALVLMIIPLSRITHMLFLAFTRAYLGSEYARPGMSGTGKCPISNGAPDRSKSKHFNQPGAKGRDKRPRTRHARDSCKVLM